MSSETLYGLDKPDELADLDLKDANVPEVIGKAYEAWLDITEELRENYILTDFKVKEKLYQEAFRLVGWLKDNLKGTLRASQIPAVLLNPAEMREPRGRHEKSDLYGEPKTAAGFYLAALLNETPLEKFVVDRTLGYYLDVGYLLQDGKTVEILEKGKVRNAGSRARGGTVINRGKVKNEMGAAASGGLFVNQGKTAYLGSLAKGGIFLNHKVAYQMGGGAKDGIFVNYDKARNYRGVSMGGGGNLGGIFINHGNADDIGDGSRGGIYFNYNKGGEISREASNSVFIDCTKSYWVSNWISDGVYTIEIHDLEKDKDLDKMVKRIKRLSKKPETVPEVKDLAHKIDAHVRKNYRPRRVA